MPVESDSKKPTTDAATSAARGEKAFAVFDYAIKVVKVSLAVLGIMIISIALSGVDMARLDEHEVFRYRMHAAPVLITSYLLIDYRISRLRATRVAAAEKGNGAANARDDFVLSVDPDADRRAAETAAGNAVSKARPKQGYAVELMALAFVTAGGAAFWHDHISNEIPDPVPVAAKFVSAKCVDRSSSRIGGSVGPHMSIGYEFPSQSTSVRASETKCLLDNCEPANKPPQHMDTKYKRVFYASVLECRATRRTRIESIHYRVDWRQRPECVGAGTIHARARYAALLPALVSLRGSRGRVADGGIDANATRT